MSFNIQRPVAPNRTGYEFTGGFSDAGGIVNYTQGMVDADQWLRFGFSSASNVSNDVAYWTDPDPSADPKVPSFFSPVAFAGVPPGAVGHARVLPGGGDHDS